MTSTYNFWPQVIVTCQRPHIPPGMVVVDPAFLKEALTLTHPDLHTEARQAKATKATAYITQILKAIER
jgi:hypothetical protein